jgi:hypothetical protein
MYGVLPVLVLLSVSAAPERLHVLFMAADDLRNDLGC